MIKFKKADIHPLVGKRFHFFIDPPERFFTAVGFSFNYKDSFVLVPAIPLNSGFLLTTQVTRNGSIYTNALVVNITELVTPDLWVEIQ